ncbi:APC family permease [Fodinibius salsisoli]|uniref:APC family permease n=1 Tax=Fodinibius salsisoli TaxID=2820877 RepID=A0ABT3PMT0_9BACT|nr:APC family permease [Fodinibius salsisoli]MCW9707250.1 APC family permease [Fodinibius salsisoli]
MKDAGGDRPAQIFTNLSAIAVIIGIVVGIGIFRLPSMVAQNVSSEIHYLAFWLAGGLISIIGALCYAELASSKPDAGGEYHFLTEAYGSTVGFLFSWGRLAIIQTGSIALAAFILGDYASVIYDLGPYSSSIYAALTIITLTTLNIWGTHPSKNTQSFLTSLIVLILLLAGVAGLMNGTSTDLEPPSDIGSSSAGAAMIFVLLTYGGWNEGVYLSAELKDVRKNITKVLISALCCITVLYLMINVAYIQVLGLETIRNSDVIGVALSNQLIGSGGSFVMAIIVIISALSTANATIITGARTNYALGRDFQRLGFLGRWNKEYNAPINSLLVQGIIALALVVLGSVTQEAVSTMVDYTAPVFWLFILLTTGSLFVFRYKEKESTSTEPSFRVPLYPATPILFMLVCCYLLYSSIAFTGSGALLGVGILLLGLPIYLFARPRASRR